MIARQRQRGSRTHIESRICSRDNATHGGLAVGDGGTRLEHKLIDVLTGMAVGEGWVGAGLYKALDAACVAHLEQAAGISAVSETFLKGLWGESGP